MHLYESVHLNQENQTCNPDSSDLELAISRAEKLFCLVVNTSVNFNVNDLSPGLLDLPLARVHKQLCM